MTMLSDELGQRGEHGIPISLAGCSPARAEQGGKLRCPLIIKYVGAVGFSLLIEPAAREATVFSSVVLGYAGVAMLGDERGQFVHHVSPASRCAMLRPGVLRARVIAGGRRCGSLWYQILCGRGHLVSSLRRVIPDVCAHV